MSRRTYLATAALLALGVAAAAAADRDFSGKWLLDADHSEMKGLIGEIFPVLTIDQQTAIHCMATTAAGGSVEWNYHLDDSDSKDRVGAESWNSKVKWEGDALLINTLVTAPEPYTIMDRWTLSHDGNQISIEREIERNGQIRKGYLVYRREGAPASPVSSIRTALAPAPARRGGSPTLARRPETPPSPPPAQYTIPAGTQILLTLTNPVSTKNSKDGDHVYLQTAMPVAQNDRMVIPRGSYVQGSVSKSQGRRARRQ